MLRMMGGGGIEIPCLGGGEDGGCCVLYTIYVQDNISDSWDWQLDLGDGHSIKSFNSYGGGGYKY